MSINVKPTIQSITSPVQVLPEASVERKTKVLLLITRLTTGGDTSVVLDVATHLNQQPGFEAHLAVGPVGAHEEDLTQLAYERAIPTTVIPDMVNHISPRRNLRALWELRQLMQIGQYDIVHTHSSVAGVLGRLAAASAGIPVIIHHVHGWGIQEEMSTGMRLLYQNLERLCTRFTNRVIAVSRPNIEKGLALHLCPEDKFVLIYYGIDLETFRQPVNEKSMRVDLGLLPTTKLVGMIGRLDKQKNPLDFIRAAALVIKEYPDVQFVIAGDGSLRPDCERLIAELKLQDKLFLLGFRSDIPKILPILTLTALSSLWEGLPFVFLESMSAGKPIVANNVDGASDVIVDGKTGYLITPHDPQEMADRILFLLTNEDRCAEMGLTAFQHSEQFSSQNMVTEIESLYREELIMVRSLK